MSDLRSNGERAEDLCLACGLCCNGVIFARVQLQPGDDAERLKALGLGVLGGIARNSKQEDRDLARNPARNLPGSAPSLVPRPAHFPQPCVAFDGCRCRIYPERPQYCRRFECALLKSVNAGKTEPGAALQIISTAKKHADNVRRLLRDLGDPEEQVALSARFRRASRRVEQSGLTEETAAAFGELTLAVHELNLLLSQAFYPGAAANDTAQ